MQRGPRDDHRNHQTLSLRRAVGSRLERLLETVAGLTKAGSLGASTELHQEHEKRVQPPARPADFHLHGTPRSLDVRATVRRARSDATGRGAYQSWRTRAEALDLGSPAEFTVAKRALSVGARGVATWACGILQIFEDGTSRPLVTVAVVCESLE